MALSYRSPVESVLTTFTTIEQSAISANAVKWYKDYESEHFALFNFALPELAKQKLWQSGIYLSPFSAMPHSHPVCKTLENYMLYTALPSYIDHSFYFVGIKNNKIEYLKKRNKSLNMICAINRYVTSADKFRYPNDFVVSRSGAYAGLNRHRVTLANCTLKDLVPEVISKAAKNLFIHDEVHYWDHSTLEVFLSTVKPEKIILTLVYPPELLIGAKESLNPWCYQFEVDGDKFRFYPDGVWSEGYTQPLYGGDLLRSNRIQLSDGTVYSVDLLCSKFAHHLVGLTRGECKHARDRGFSNFDAVSAKRIQPICSASDSVIPVPFEVISKVYRYLRTLNKPDPQSAMAKLSQIVPDPTGYEIKFVQDFSRLVVETNQARTLFINDPLKSWLNHIIGILPPVLGRFFKDFKSLTLDNFIAELEPLKFNIKLGTFGLNSLLSDLTTSPEADIDCSEVSRGFETFWGACLQNSQASNSRPYSSTSISFDSIDFNGDWLKCLICKYIKVSHASNVNILIAVRRIIHFSKMLLAKNKLTALLVPFISIDFALSVQKRVKAMLISKRRIYFWGNRLYWLFERKMRHNCKFIQSTESSKEGFFMRRERYATVIADLLDSRRSKDAALPFLPPCALNTEPEAPIAVLEPALPLSLELTEPITSNFTCTCNSVIEVEQFHCGIALALKFNENVRGSDWAFYSSIEGACYLGDTPILNNGWPELISAMIEANRRSCSVFDSLLALRYNACNKPELIFDDLEFINSEKDLIIVMDAGRTDLSLLCKGNPCCGFELSEGLGATFIGNHAHGLKIMAKNFKPGNVLLVLFQRKPAKNQTEEMSHCLSDSETSESEVVAREMAACNFGATVNMKRTFPLAAFKEIEVPEDGDCFWHALGFHLGIAGSELKRTFVNRARIELRCTDALSAQFGHKVYAENESIAAASFLFRCEIKIIINPNGSTIIYSPVVTEASFFLKLSGEHFTPLLPKNDCVVKACAESLGKQPKEIYRVITRKENSVVFNSLCSGEGLSLALIEDFFKIFDVRAYIDFDGEQMLANEKGSIDRSYSIEDDHITYNGKKKIDKFNPNIVGAFTGISYKSRMELKSCGTTLLYNTSFGRASRLADSLQNGTTGAISSTLFNGEKNLLEGISADQEPTELCAILGTFGSGKSTLFKNLFRNNPGKLITFVSPRKSLAFDFKVKIFGNKFNQLTGAIKRDKLNCNFSVVTFETFLKSAKNLKNAHTVVIDEIQLFPPGYLDLVCTLLTSGISIFVVGDPCQSNYDSENDRSIFLDMPSDIHNLLKQSEYKYVVSSKRFVNSNFVGRLPCNFHTDFLKVKEEYLVAGDLNDLRKMSKDYTKTFLVASFDEKKIVKANFPEALNLLTFGESTGRTFERGTIVITSSAQSVCEERWLTALSRFSHNLCLLVLMDVTLETLAETFADRALGKFLCKRASLDDLKAMLPGKPNFSDNYIARIGKDMGVKELKLAGDPWLKTQIYLGQEEDYECVELAKEISEEPWFKTHLPRCDLEAVRAKWVHKIKAKEDREYRIGTIVSNQFTDEHSKNQGKALTNAAERFETIYPRHRGNDTVTFLMAVKKRLRFSKPQVECAKLRAAENYGKYLLDIFLKHVPLDPKHDNQLMAASLREFEEKKTSKSTATIENHAGRSCRDWLADVGLVFMKSQICTKYENRFRNAKAAQSIVCFQHSVLCRFAPYMRYIEKKLSKALPANLYIHSGKGLEELNSWVMKNDFRGICTESDYEAFDASQDEYIVAFEIACMKYLGIPNDLIADYKYIKTHLGSKLGSFAIMRFSGEASTFLFNTMANMLFTFMKYDLNGKEAICFAGDDMCAAKRLRLSIEHEKFLSKMKLKAKVQFVSNPTFCGWCLTPDGIFKKPQLVLERLCIAKETNNLINCIDNYAIEVGFAYSMGERVISYLDEDSMDSYYNCVRIIIKNKHLLKSDIRALYES